MKNNTLSAFESVLDDAMIDLGSSGDTISAYESMLDSAMIEIGLESMFGEGVVAQLIAKARTKIETECTTVELCDEFSEKLQVETAKFNGALDNMKLAAEEHKTDQITKSEFVARVQPYLAELRNSCNILNISDIDDVDSEGVSDSDVANLRAFILGVAEIISTRREDLSRSQGGDTPTESIESFIDYLDNLEIATEAIDVQAVKDGFKKKKDEAVATVAKAKAAFKEGSYTKASALYAKAKSMFGSLGQNAKKVAKDTEQENRLKKSFAAAAAKCESAIAKIKKKKVAKESFLDGFDFSFESDIELDEEVVLEMDELDEDETEDIEEDVDEAFESLMFELEFAEFMED